MARLLVVSAVIVAVCALAVSPAAWGDSPYEKYGKYMSKYYKHLEEAEEEAAEGDWHDYHKEMEKAEKDYAKAQSYRYIFDRGPVICDRRITEYVPFVRERVIVQQVPIIRERIIVVPRYGSPYFRLAPQERSYPRFNFDFGYSDSGYGCRRSYISPRQYSPWGNMNFFLVE